MNAWTDTGRRQIVVEMNKKQRVARYGQISGVECRVSARASCLRLPKDWDAPWMDTRSSVVTYAVHALASH